MSASHRNPQSQNSKKNHARKSDSNGCRSNRRVFNAVSVLNDLANRTLAQQLELANHQSKTEQKTGTNQ
jgi:hypothetical protein